MFNNRSMHPRRPNPHAKMPPTAAYKVLVTSPFRIAGARRSEGDIVHMAAVAAQHLVLANLIEPVDPPSAPTPAPTPSSAPLRAAIAAPSMTPPAAQMAPAGVAAAPAAPAV